MLGAAYEKIADSGCPATTLRRRRDEWIAAGVFEDPEQMCLDAYDRIVGIEFADLAADGCIVKAPCGGEAAGKSPLTAASNAPSAPCWSTAGASRWAP